MIQRIGVIYQDVNSRGFLEGLRDRLDCDAELIPPPAAIGKQRVMRRRDLKNAWSHFQKQNVDLVVRFTDADSVPWRDVQRKEVQRTPEDAKSLWVCGVAVENVEDWLALDPDYLASQINVLVSDLQDPSTRTGCVKSAINRQSTSTRSETVRHIVRSLPTDVFRTWLQGCDSLRTFYADCRQAAARQNCETPNEL